METNYVILLDYSSGEIIKIRLSDEEMQKSESYEDFEMFLSTIESKCNFFLSDILLTSNSNPLIGSYICSLSY